MTTLAARTGLRSGRGALRAVPRRAFHFCRWISPLLILCGLWELLSRSGLVNPDVLPPFSSALVDGWAMIDSGEIFPQLGTSLYRALVGLLIGSAVGIFAGITMALSDIVRRAVYPIVTLTYALPKSALIPIALLWLGVGNASTILVIVFGTAVPMIINSFHGAESVPERFIWSARSMGAARWRTMVTVIIPAAMPHILNGLRMALPLSFILVISAEMVASFIGVGQYIFMFGQSGSYASMFGAIIIVMVVAFVLDQVVTRATNHMLRWVESEPRHG